MSHFSQIKTNIKNRTTLEKALRSLGYEVETGTAEASVSVRGFFGETQNAELKIHAGGNYDIGFHLTEEGYEAIGDWELLPRVAGLEQEEFLKKLRRAYAKESILEIAKAHHYSVECNENSDTNEIEMVVTQW